MKRVRAAAMYLWRLLLLHGDIESNPGPMTKPQEEKLDFVFDAVKRMEASNISLLESVNKVLHIHITLKNDYESLSKRVTELESRLESSISAQIPANNDAKLSEMQNQIVVLQSKIQSCGSSEATTSRVNISIIRDKIDDLENRSRRSNVLFYGIADGGPTESWEAVQKIVTDFCQNQLGLTVTSIARAHRLGRFLPDKTRPIIAKFFNDKEVEAIISRGSKLKNTLFGLSRDFSKPVREKRRNLLQFSKTIKKESDRVRLVFDRLHINDDVYVWDPNTNQAAPITNHAALSQSSSATV